MRRERPLLGGTRVASTRYGAPRIDQRPRGRAECGWLGIVGVAMVLLWSTQTGEAGCPNECSGKGVCTKNNTCICEATHRGADCSERTCPKGTAWLDFASAVDTAHAPAECSNMGLCDAATGFCKCRSGFFGQACDKMRCPGSIDSGDDCSGHGACMSMGEIATRTDSYDLRSSTTYDIWDANMIMGCLCDRGWTGYDCSLRSCPYGDDPLTTSDTADEVQIIDCLCGTGCGGTFTISYRDEMTTALTPSSSHSDIQTALQALRGVVGVTVSHDGGAAVCDSDGVATKITFTHQPGDLAPLILTSSLTQTSGTPTLVLREGGASSIYGSTPASVNGNRENVECSNRGVCDRATGLCTCSTIDNTVLYKSSNGAGGTVALAEGGRGDCGFAPGTVTQCPTGESGTTCTGHGSCSGSPTYVCTCNSGYTGADCSLQTCPSGKAWWDKASSSNTAHAAGAECSNFGICDRTAGTCTCSNIGTGSACDQLACPEVTGSSLCNNQGSCASIATFASSAKINGVTQSFTYGTNNLAKTWDFDMMYGCMCDTNVYHGPLVGAYGKQIGYDCTRAVCPSGDDPQTASGLYETQAIICTATSGTLTLTFRGDTTASINYNADASTLEASLEALSSVRTLFETGVTVSYSSGSALCTSGGSNVASVTFKQVLGDLPLMTATSGSLNGGASVIIAEKTVGTKENAECSNRGKCDRETGQCLCFYGFTSSDGNGNGGSRGDCGHINAFQTSAQYPVISTTSL